MHRQSQPARAYIWALAVLAYAMGAPVISYAIDAQYEQALQAISDNRISEAKRILEEHIADHPTHTDGYLVLSVLYEQTGDYHRAIRILNDGVTAAATDRHIFFFNIGNNHYALQEYEQSDSAFRKAIIEQPGFSASYVNIANIKTRAGEYQEALDYYTHYLSLDPQGERSSEVKSMIAVIRDILQAEDERQRLLRAREQQLLEDALSSLEDSENDGRDVRAQPADIIKLDDELEIVD